MFSKELENTNGFQMAKLILDLMKITRCLVLESRHGQMEGNILDFMLQIRNVAMVFLHMLMAARIKAPG